MLSGEHFFPGNVGENMKKQLAVATIVISMLSGCAPAPYRPIVDYGTPKNDYDADVQDCQGVASAVQPANTAAAGAVAGAVLGALLGAAVGLKGHYVANVAAFGAVDGAAHGLAYGSVEWTRVVNRCMVGRGYNVVG